MNLNLLPISMLLAAVGIIVGLAMFFKTASLIEMQIKFYAKINWRMEPISMPKEIKNTKFMGLVLVTFCLLAIIYVKFFLRRLV